MARAGWRCHAAALCTCAATAGLGACLPGELTLAPGDASPGDDGSLVDVRTADGSGSGGSDAEAGGGLHDAPSDADVHVPDAGAHETGGGDAGTGKDTGADAGDACTTGCPPPPCTCVPPVPSGWTLVAFNATSHGFCPIGYTTPTNVLVDPTNLGPSTCSCSCDVTTQPDCYSGQVTITYGTGNCGTSAGGFDVDGGTCMAAALPFSASNHAVAPIPPSGGSCSPTVTETPPSPGGSMGKTCTVANAPTTGSCSAGQVCAPPGTATYALCIAQSGHVACPSDHPNAHTVGTGITGGGCGACSCAAPNTSCDSPMFTVYSDGACATSIASMTADGTCQAVTAGVAVASYLYTATPNTGCVPPTQPQPTGNATLSDQGTVCCP
jgi:hypothetical protein